MTEKQKSQKTLPLQLAICEVRFPGDPEVETQRGAFYRMVRDEFPTLYVPNFEEGGAVALQPYRFSAQDESRWLMLAVNSLSYGVMGAHYDSFKTFKNSFRGYLEKFREVYSYLEGFTKIGLRYINHVPVERGIYGEITAAPVSIPSLIEGDVQNTLHVSEYQAEGGVIRVAVDTTQQELPPTTALVDFDFSYNTDAHHLFTYDDLDNYLEKAHTVTKNALNTLLDKDYAREVGIS